MSLRKNKKRSSGSRWSRAVTRHSNDLNLDEGVFTKRSAHQITLSLKHSAPQQAAQGDTFPIGDLNYQLPNQHDGKNMLAERKRVLREGKDELQKIFHRASRYRHRMSEG